MKKIIFETIGTTIMLVLWGLFITAEAAQEGIPIVMLVILGVYLIIYFAISMIWNKRLGLPLGHQLGGIARVAKPSRHESPFCLKAAKEGFLTTQWIMVSALLFFSILGHYLVEANFNMYVVGCWLIILFCIVSLISYTRAWCREYELAERTTSPSR